MSKLLEKTLKDSLKEKKCILGSKEVLNSLKNSKLVLISQSVKPEFSEKITEDATKNKVPTVTFSGSSVALGRLCGLQFRVSTVAFTSLSDASIKSILKEKEEE